MPEQINIRFYEELNDFLPQELRKTDFSHELKGARSIKDLIESIGVPHTEIDLIIVNGVSVDFNYPVQNGDYISVYPVFESLDISPLNHCQEKPSSDDEGQQFAFGLRWSIRWFTVGESRHGKRIETTISASAPVSIPNYAALKLNCLPAWGIDFAVRDEIWSAACLQRGKTPCKNDRQYEIRNLWQSP